MPMAEGRRDCGVCVRTSSGATGAPSPRRKVRTAGFVEVVCFVDGVAAGLCRVPEGTKSIGGASWHIIPGTTGCAPTRSRGTLFLWKRPSFLLPQLEVVVEAQGRWPGPARRCQGRGTHDTRHGEAKRHCWARQGRAGRDLGAG